MNLPKNEDKISILTTEFNNAIENLQSLEETELKKRFGKNIKDIKIFQKQLKELKKLNEEDVKNITKKLYSNLVSNIVINNTIISLNKFNNENELRNELEKTIIEELLFRNDMMSKMINEKDIRPNYSPDFSNRIKVMFKEEDSYLDPRSTDGNTKKTGRYSNYISIVDGISSELLEFLLKKLKNSYRKKFIEYLNKKTKHNEKDEELLKESIIENFSTISNKLGIDFYKELKKFHKEKNQKKFQSK